MKKQTPLARLRDCWALVGDTPMLAVRVRVDGRELSIYAKLESENFTGSIKDRMALHMLEHAYARGSIDAGDTIVEVSSGNTGISFAALGRALGHPVRIYMPSWMSPERRSLIASFGAEIIDVTKEEGGFVGAITLADAFARANDSAFRPQQFANRWNSDAHRVTTGREILTQLASRGLVPDAFVAGVGTGGTVMGVGAALRAHAKHCAIHPLEPANSPTLRTGSKDGQHRIQGISDEFIPPIVDLASLDSIVDVWDGDSILMAQKLATSLGLAVGISSGANFLGALQLALAREGDPVVVTVFPDSNKKYLSTDLLRKEPERDGYLAPRVELLDFRAIPRAASSHLELCADRHL
ncbi:MAG: PLP-dependent cysteine synthase family protein [Planctomycetes bacterium]|nr:PLP-dependent cysteine synthase family protein [Planctomycetota bacterium]